MASLNTDFDDIRNIITQTRSASISPKV